MSTRLTLIRTTIFKGCEMRKRKKNVRIRTLIKNAGLTQWEAGEMLGYTESAFSRKLRKELPEDEQNRLISKLKKAIAEHEFDELGL